MFKLEFKTDNAAFQDDNFAYEVKRILYKVALQVNNGQTEGNILDVNGNLIGHFSW
jgi:hypothetical protein